MAVYRIGSAAVELKVIGAGLRGGAFSDEPLSWDFSEKAFHNYRAFNKAGWKFQHETTVNWEAVESSDPLVRGLLAEHPSGGLVILRDWLVLQFKDNIAFAEAESRLRQQYLRVLPLELGDRLFAVELSLESRDLEGQILRELSSLREDSAIIFAEPSIFYHLGAPEPTEVHVDGVETWHWEKIKVEEAWETAGEWREGRGRHVAIIDQGFHSHDPQIEPNVGWKLTLGAEGNLVAPDCVPEHYHGTMCAGLVGAIRDGEGVSGAAPACRLGLVALADFCVCTQEALGIALKICAGLDPLAKKVSKWREADVISCSLGITGKNWELGTPLRMAIDAVIHEGRGGRGTPIIWATFNSDEKIECWAVEGHKPLLTVSQSNINNERVGSAWGESLDLLAPGYAVSVIYYDANGKRWITNKEGASLAAPCVAGVAALVLAVNSDLTGEQVAEVITHSCDEVGPNPDRPNPCVGWGRLNAQEAVAEALKRRKESEPAKTGAATPAHPSLDPPSPASPTS